MHLNDLILESTVLSPRVELLTSGNLYFAESSTPSAADIWYAKIFDWLKEFATTNPPRLNVEFNFKYLNSGSMRCIAKMLYLIKSSYSPEYCVIQIIWWCQDEDLEELGDILRGTTALPFEVLPAN